MLSIIGIGGTALVPQPTAAATASVSDDAEAVVRQFYGLLELGDLDSATPLMSGRLRDAVSWDPAVMHRRTPTQRLTVNRVEVTALDSDDRVATVAIDVVEQTGPPLAVSRRYLGSWALVRGPAGWLLDSSDIDVHDD